MHSSGGRQEPVAGEREFWGRVRLEEGHCDRVDDAENEDNVVLYMASECSLQDELEVAK